MSTQLIDVNLMISGYIPPPPRHFWNEFPLVHFPLQNYIHSQIQIFPTLFSPTQKSIVGQMYIRADLQFAVWGIDWADLAPVRGFEHGGNKLYLICIRTLKPLINSSGNTSWTRKTNCWNAQHWRFDSLCSMFWC